MASESVVQPPAPIAPPPTEQLDFAFDGGPADQPGAGTNSRTSSQASVARNAQAALYRAATGR